MPAEDQFRKDWKKPVVLVTTGFGSGLVPVMPGSVTSLLAMLYWWYFVADLDWFFQCALIVASASIAFVSIRYVQARYGLDDHPSITIDELVGQWCALFVLPSDLLPMILGFLFFRAFDVFKPWPIRQAEKLHGAVGVLLDDVLSGIAACALVHFFIFLGTRMGSPLFVA